MTKQFSIRVPRLSGEPLHAENPCDPPAPQPDTSGLQLLYSGVSAFAARLRLARQAVYTLDLMYYIWERDLTGRILLGEVLAAADRGVTVRLLLDDIGVSSRDDVLQALDAHPRITVRLFNPVMARKARRWSWRKMTRRMHNKARIADGRSAVMGGRNIGDAYFDAAELSNFRDLDLFALGPVVQEAEAMFAGFWNSLLVKPVLPSQRGGKIEDTLDMLRGFCASAEARRYLAGVEHEGQKDAKLHWCASARLVADPPKKALGRRGENGLMETLLPVLEAARNHIVIISPYFVPELAGTRRLTALTALTARGVGVMVLTNSLAATDVAAVNGAYAKYRKPLVRAGVDLHELRPTDGRSGRPFGAKAMPSCTPRPSRSMARQVLWGR